MVDNTLDDPIDRSDASSAELDMETVTLDGEIVEVPRGYAEKFHQIETNMKSGLNRKHEAKQKDLATKLKTDKDWLNLHATRPDLWEYYEPTIDGGRGFIGSNDMLEESSKTTTANQQSTVSNAEVAELKQKLADLEKRVSGVQTDTDENLRGQAGRARDTILGRYNYVDKENLTIKMEHYYMTHGKHPSAEIIEEFAKVENTRIAGVIDKKSKAAPVVGAADTTTLPIASNTPPGGTKPKLPRLDDIRGIGKLMEDMNVRM